MTRCGPHPQGVKHLGEKGETDTRTPGQRHRAVREFPGQGDRLGSGKTGRRDHSGPLNCKLLRTETNGKAHPLHGSVGVVGALRKPREGDHWGWGVGRASGKGESEGRRPAGERRTRDRDSINKGVDMEVAQSGSFHGALSLWSRRRCCSPQGGWKPGGAGPGEVLGAGLRPSLETVIRRPRGL